jgi:spore coat polysaccharide biosynthesis predicted glycosyltransferase SpsG
MSSIMEKADLAISSAGRTMYELAHMRVPSIIMSQHEREETHTFARAENGFEYIGLMNPFNSQRLIESFNKMLDTQNRKRLYDCMKKFRFERNKKRVIKRIMALLDEE